MTIATRGKERAVVARFEVQAKHVSRMKIDKVKIELSAYISMKFIIFFSEERMTTKVNNVFDLAILEWERV